MSDETLWRRRSTKAQAVQFNEAGTNGEEVVLFAKQTAPLYTVYFSPSKKAVTVENRLAPASVAT